MSRYLAAVVEMPPIALFSIYEALVHYENVGFEIAVEITRCWDCTPTNSFLDLLNVKWHLIGVEAFCSLATLAADE
jgi:hypothetical protein